MLDHYGALGVARRVSAAEIRSAYQQKVLQLHPDKQASGSGGVEATDRDSMAFVEVQRAWETLRDPEARKAYDEALAAAEAAEQITIADELQLSDMDRTTNEDGSTAFLHPCRCGEAYVAAAAELAAGPGEVLVACSGCSFHVRITISKEDVELLQRELRT
eukprot:tig00021127_g18702.t1